jgi:hypothetical protein
MVRLTPDDLNDLLEWIAFAANHAETRQLEKELDVLYDRLQRVEDSLDVVEGASPISSRDIRSSKRREMMNRCVVVAKAKEPFLEWLKGLPDPCDATLERVNREATAYLLPDFEEEPEWERILRRYAGAIFEDQLAAWWLDEADWPARRDLRTFKTWFHVEVHPIVLDLADGPIARVV